MKKLMMAAIGLMMAMSANAQYLNESGKVFSQDKWYVGISTSGLDLNWNKISKWSLNLQAKGGYLFADDWMVLGNIGWETQADAPNFFKAGAGIRYYFESCGIYAGLIGNYMHYDEWNEFRPEVHVGYAYFLTGKLTIEPEIYYQQTTKSGGSSGIGLRVGFGLFF